MAHDNRSSADNKVIGYFSLAFFIGVGALMMWSVFNADSYASSPCTPTSRTRTDITREGSDVIAYEQYEAEGCERNGTFYENPGRD